MRLALLSAIVLSALPIPSHAQSRALSDAEKKIISSIYSDRLKDPMSAQYRWLPLPLNSKARDAESGYCFYANAKNSYGGYVGFKLILGKVRQARGKVVDYAYVAGHLDDNAALSQTTAAMCRALGMELQSAQ